PDHPRGDRLPRPPVIRHISRRHPRPAGEGGPVTTRFRILIADPLHESAWQLLRQEPDVEVCGPFESRDALLKVLEDADALIVRSNTRVDAELLLAAPRLKVVARAGAGLENVDIDFATRRGVLVINA